MDNFTLVSRSNVYANKDTNNSFTASKRLLKDLIYLPIETSRVKINSVYGKHIKFIIYSYYTIVLIISSVFLSFYKMLSTVYYYNITIAIVTVLFNN